MRQLMLVCAVVVGILGQVVSARSVPEPRYGLFADRADIERARERSHSTSWGREYRHRVFRVADTWLERNNQWIREILPPPGAKFSYGVAGCPKCGKGWGRFGLPVANLDRPLILICQHCETTFDLRDEDGPYADPGDGVVINNQRFYLRGVWNAFVVQSMWAAFNPESAALVNLADAYALTGDERYAAKAIVIMDALATLAPQTIGPRDFVTRPDEKAGRLHHLTSIMYRAQVHLARALDLVGNHPDLAKPSPTNPDAPSIWENIRQGIFLDYMGTEFDNRGGRLHTLHNHEADSVRSLIVYGLLFGEADHLRWGAQSAEAFFDNVIDRDGLYYETSLSYASFSRGVFTDMAELLARYDPSRYRSDSNMPAREELPYAGNYFNHPNLARLMLDVRPRTTILGREPAFGNNNFDTRVWKRPGRAFDRFELQQALRFLVYSTDPDIRKRAANLAASMLRFSDARPHGGFWRLYLAPDDKQVLALATVEPADVIPAEDRSEFFGNTGLMYLRSGESAMRRGAVMRVGMNMPHAHDDQMALMLFAHGRALSGDIGYGIFGNHTHLGWAGRAISHHTVVVNQDESGTRQLFRIGPGGTIHRFDQVPGVTWMEATLTEMFAPEDQISDYRRLVIQVDLSPESFYWIDLFDIDGGRVHDYSMHAPPLSERGSFAIKGADVQPVPGVWTMAALDPKWRDASFNQPTRSWGERLTVDGMLAKIPGVEDEVVPQRWWYPPPSNGYGFLHDIKLDHSDRRWSATWRWQDKQERYGLRLTMLPERSQQVISARGPNLNGTAYMQWMIARSGEPTNTEPIRTRFAGVIEAFVDDPKLTSVEALRQNGRIVGLRITADDQHDVLLDARFAPVELKDIGSLDSGLALLRYRDNELYQIVTTGASRLITAEETVELPQALFRGKIVEVDDDRGRFRIEPRLSSSAVGSTITITNPAYTHGSAYRIGAIDDGWITPLNSGITLGRARVDAVTDDGFVSTAPLVFGFEYGKSTRFLTGKRIVAGNQTGHVVDMTDFKALVTTGISPKPGDAFVVYDVQPGDDVVMEITATRFLNSSPGTPGEGRGEGSFRQR